MVEPPSSSLVCLASRTVSGRANDNNAVFFSAVIFVLDGRLLLEKGADLQLQDDQGQGALHKVRLQLAVTLGTVQQGVHTDGERGGSPATGGGAGAPRGERGGGHAGAGGR